MSDTVVFRKFPIINEWLLPWSFVNKGKTVSGPMQILGPVDIHSEHLNFVFARLENKLIRFVNNDKLNFHYGKTYNIKCKVAGWYENDEIKYTRVTNVINVDNIVKKKQKRKIDHTALLLTNSGLDKKLNSWTVNDILIKKHGKSLYFQSATGQTTVDTTKQSQREFFLRWIKFQKKQELEVDGI